MKIGIGCAHLYNEKAGGYQAFKWHLLAFLALGHSVDVYTTNTPSQSVLDHWFDGVPLRHYSPHVERGYDYWLGIDHFRWFYPEAKRTAHHVFFPQPDLKNPPEETVLFSNSAYTADHIKNKWGRDVSPVYIPIDTGFYCGSKENIILHVSRFSEPSVYADKAHRQLINCFKIVSRKEPKWKFVIAGSVDPNQNFYFSELQRLAAGYNIDFMPNLSQKALVDLFAKSAVYWHATGVSLPNIPSAQEHMGITPLEAQASGCVPIVYNSGGMPEVVQASKTGLLFDNIADLPYLTMELLGRMKDWSALSQAGQIWAREWQDFDAFVGRIDDMLSDRPITPMGSLNMFLKYSPADVTIVIPTYNSPHLEKLLASMKQTAPTSRVLVINNGDPLNYAIPDNVTVMDVGDNLGFAGAHKFASQLISTPMVFMANDDMDAPNEGWLEHLLHVMNNDKVGVVGSKLLFADGRLQFAGGSVDWNSRDIGYHRFYGLPDGIESSTPIECDFVTGAALLCRRELYDIPDELIDGLNFEDTWMCFNAREKGLKVVYQPASVLTHFEGDTKKRTPESQEKVARNRMSFERRWRS